MGTYIIITLLLLVVFSLFLINRKSNNTTYDNTEYSCEILKQPTITVVFTDSTPETEEIADMFINHRKYYYTGKQEEKSSLQKEKVFIQYKSIQFDHLIDVNV